MPRMYFNWKLALVLIISLVVVGVTAFGLRKWQRNNSAVKSLELGIKAYNEQNWNDAAKNLGTYVAVETEDVPRLLMYAEAQLNRRPRKSTSIQQAINTYRIILRVDNSHSEAAIKLTKIYLAMNMPGEAELIAKKVLDISQNLELNRILALSLAAQREFEPAAQELKNIIAEHPDQVLVYESLGQLNRLQPDLFSVSPIHWLNESVSNNPSSALAYITRADFYLADNDRTAALTDLEQAEKLDLEDSEIRLRLARAFINMELLDKAEEHLRIVQAANPTSMALWQTWVQLGLKSRSNEKLLIIAEAGLQAMSSQPWDFMPIATEIFIKNEKYKSAEECISKLTQNDMNPAIIAFLEGLLAESKGNSYEAVKYWQRAVQLGNDSPQTRLTLASLLFRLGDAQSALKQLNTLIADNPDHLEGLLTIAKISSEIGDWAKVAESAHRVLQLSGDNREASLLYCQARINLLSKSAASPNSSAWDEIHKQLSDLLGKDSGNISIRLIQFMAFLSQKKYPEARQLFTQLQKDYPENLQVATSEVNLFVVENKIDDAISTLNRIITEYPDSVGPVEQLAILLVRQNNYDQCEQILKDALTRIKTPAELRKLNLLMAELYTRLKREKDAYNVLNTLAKANPNDISVKHRLLGCGLVIEDQEKSQQIIDDIKLLEGDEGWQWKYEQAKLWFTTKIEERSTQIITLLKENLLSNPGDLSSIVLLAATYEKTDNLQLAISAYRQALDRSPGDMRIIIPFTATLYKANEYEQADEILNSIPGDDETYNPDLSRLQLQNYLRHGQLDSASDTLNRLLTRDPDNQAARLSLAILKMHQKKYDQAEKLLDEIRIHDPDSLSVIAAQIQLNLFNDKADEAIKICNETVEKLNSAKAYILRAKTYSSLKKTDKAIMDFDQAITMEPDNYEVWTHRSDFYRIINQPDKAIADIRQALILNENDIQIQKRVISLLITSRNPDLLKEGQELLSKALLSQPEDIELLLVKSHLLISKGTPNERDDAIRTLEQLTEDHPEANQAWVLLGDIRLRQGKRTQALDAAMRGLSYKINDKKLLLLKALAEASRSTILAIPTYQMLHELYPDDLDIVMYLANAYIEAREYTKVENLIAEQLSIRKDESEIKKCNLAMSIALFKKGKKSEAEKKLDQLSRTYPDDNMIILTHADLLTADKQWSKVESIAENWLNQHPDDTQTPIKIAEKVIAYQQQPLAIQTSENILEMVIDKYPDDISAMQGLAIIMHMTDRCKQAVKLNQQVLAKDPENIIIMNNLAWILCEEQGQYQQALELVEKGLNLTPGYTDMIDTRGVVHYRMGNFNEAIQDFSRCLEMYPSGDPSLVASYFHLGKAFAGIKETEKALKNLRTSLDMAIRVGGLSSDDSAEARNLIESLSK